MSGSTHRSAVSLTDFQLTSNPDAAARVESECLHPGDLDRAALLFDRSGDEFLGHGGGGTSAFDQLEFLFITGSDSWLGVAILHEEVQLIVHGHDLPAKLEDISQLGLDDGLLAVSADQLHEHGVAELDLSSGLDQVSLRATEKTFVIFIEDDNSRNGHVVSGLDLASQHAGIVAGDLVELVHGSDESRNAQVVRLDDDSSPVGAVEHINQATVAAFDLPLVTEVFQLFLDQFALLSLLGLLLLLFQSNRPHSEVLGQTENQRGLGAVGHLDSAGIELILDEHHSGEGLGIFDLDLDAFVVADGLDGIGGDRHWRAEGYGSLGLLPPLLFLEAGPLVGFLVVVEFCSVVILGDGSGDAMRGWRHIGGGREAGVLLLDDAEVLIEVNLVIGLGISVNGVEDVASAMAAVVIHSSASKPLIMEEEGRETDVGLPAQTSRHEWRATVL